LDLLLHLIEQQELDITAISLAQVTDQYLAYLRVIQEIRPDDLTDFVAIAARLLLIKSRALLPTPPKLIEEDQETSTDLIWQLREYKRFKQVAQILQQRDLDRLHMYARIMPTNKLTTWEPKLDLEGTSVDDLIVALRALIEVSEPASEIGIVPYNVTIDDKIAQINRLLHSHQTLVFDDLLQDATSRVEVIVTLLAVLELIRDRSISAWQEKLFGEILIVPTGKQKRSADASQ
jgi:segregation and condensation protein A